MGWSSCNRCGETHWDFFQDNWGQDFEILECSPKGFKYLYLAVKSKKSQQVFGVAVSHSWTKEKYGMLYNYRDDDESCGPVAEAPENVLLRLTPTDSPYAIGWRKECWERINKRKVLSLKAGDVLTFDREIEFTDGSKLKELTVLTAKPLRFKSSYGSYRVRDIYSMNFKATRNGKEITPQKPKERCMNSREFQFQFDFAQADWSKIGEPRDYLKDNSTREFEHTFGRNWFVYKIKETGEYSVVTRTRNTQWHRGKPITLYKHTVISEETFIYLKKLVITSKLGA